MSSLFFVGAFICSFQLILQHGAEADRHLFRCLFSHVDFSGDAHSSGKDTHQVCSYSALSHEKNSTVLAPGHKLYDTSLADSLFSSRVLVAASETKLCVHFVLRYR